MESNPGLPINAPIARAPVTPPDRAALIAWLIQRVGIYQSAGMSERAAIRATADDIGMHPMRVKRLAVLFPEA